MNTILANTFSKINPSLWISAVILTFASLGLQSQDSGRSLDFDGIDDHVVLSGADDMGHMNHWDEAYTVELWINNDDSQANARAIDIGSATSRLYIIPSDHNGNLKFGVDNSTIIGPQLFSGWNHVAVTVTAGNLAKLYLNDAEVGSVVVPSLVSGGGLTTNFIARSFANDPYFKGRIDEVRFWSTALTQMDISDQKACELSGNETELIAYYKMNGGLGDGYNGGSSGENQLSNWGVLSDNVGNLHGFTLNGLTSNWSSNSALNIDLSNQNCMEFDRMDFFQIPGNSPIVLSNGFTVQMWFYSNESSYGELFLRTGQGSRDVAITLGNGGANMKLGFEGTTGPNHVGEGQFQDRKWHHLVFRAENLPGNQVYSTIMIDGGLTSERTTSGVMSTSTAGTIRIGRNIKGRMSNLQVWNRAITEAEVDKYKSAKLPSDTDNLLAQYNTFTDLTPSLIDHINGTNAPKIGNPLFTTDPCFVNFEAQLEDELTVELGGSMNLDFGVTSCIDSDVIYTWYHNEEIIPGANNAVYVTNVANEDYGIYRLEVTVCGVTYKSSHLTVVSNSKGIVLKFDGVNDYVTIPTNTTTSQYTIETWVRFDSDPTNQAILFLSNDNGPEQYYNRQLRVNAEGYFEHSAFSTEMKTVHHPVKPEINQWYHLSGTVTGSHISIAVDNVAGESKSFANPVGGNIWYLGHPVCGHDAFDGEMADLRIKTNVSNTFSDYELLTNPGNLEHYFKFDEGFGGVDNNFPIASDTITPTFTAAVAQLFNFDLNGENSNWMPCDQESETNTFSQVPQSGIYDYEEELTLRCKVVGDPASASFQWLKNDQLISGATDSTYTIESLQPKDEGEYSVRVSDQVLCDVYSPKATIAVEGPGQVLAFDGVDDYLDISTTPITEYTIEMWVKFDDEVTNQSIFYGTDVNNEGALTHQLYTNENGYFSHYTFTNTGYTQVSTVQAESNRWYHVAIRSSAGSGEDISMVIDGQVVASTPNTSNTVPWQGLNRYLVGKSRGSLDAFKGQIDALHIHNNWVSIEVFELERFVEKKYLVGLHHSFLFNQGFADGDNTDILSDGIIDYGQVYENVVEKGTCTMVNFAKNGTTSNWSGCSPAQKPYMFIETTPNDPVVIGGQDILLSAGLLNFIPDNDDIDVSDVNYQWVKNGEHITGATSDRLEFFPAQLSDTGSYELIVTDNCPIDFRDTTDVIVLNEGICYIDFASDTIDLSDQTSYIGGTGPAIGFDFVDMADIENPLQQDFEIQSGYCGSDSVYIDGSVAYYWNVAQPQTFDVKLTMGSAVNLDMWIFDDQCDISQCLGSSTNPGTAADSINVFLDVGDYYIVIDTKDGEDEDSIAGRFYLDIAEVDNCAGSAPIACGDQINDNTNTGTSTLLGYCSDFSCPGNEKVYELVLTDQVTVDVSLSGISENLDLFILDNTCRLDQCIASSTNPLTDDESITIILDAGTYYVVADGKDGVTSEFELTVDCQSDFTASFEDNDAYVDLAWSLNAPMYAPQDTGVVVQLITQPNTVLFEEEYNVAADIPAILEGEYRDYIGPDVTKLYRLKIINRLSGVSIYNELRTGKTLPFQQPEILSISQGDGPHKIDIQWRNHSKLSDNYRILRDGEQIAILLDGYTEDSLIVAYTDIHDINDPSSIQDDASADYSIRTFSTNFFESYTDVTVTGSTSDINFAASDLTYADKVDLTWADVSAHCNRVKLERNGIILDIISSAETMYSDMTPIHGEPVLYSMTMMQDAVEIMEVEDIGTVAANGLIEGAVSTSGTGLPVHGVMVTLSKDTTINGQQTFTTVSNTTTDFLGRYTFLDISYGLANDFQVSIAQPGFTFISEVEDVTLNSAIPESQGIDFMRIEDITLDSVATSIDTLYVDVNDELGLVDINWDYAYPLATQVTFFLFRDGDLIFESDDSNGKVSTFRDRTGVPNADYNYTLQAFSEDGGNTIFQSRVTPAKYPVIPVLSGFDYFLDGEEFEDSNHNSTIGFRFQDVNYSSSQINIDGLRIFRNGQLVGEIQQGTTFFRYLAPPAIESGYSIRGFRKIGEASYESGSFPETDSLITALPLFPVFVDNPGFGGQGGLGGLQAGQDGQESKMSSAISNDLSGSRVIFTAYQFPLDENGFPMDNGQQPTDVVPGFSFDGVRIERKLSSDPDSTYTIVDNLAKNFIIAQMSGAGQPAFYDTYALPGESYDYRVSSYLEVEGVEYMRDTIIQRFMDDIKGPSNLNKNEDLGKVTLNWEDISQFNEQSYYFFNYDGVMVTRKNLTVSGSMPDTIAFLPARVETYTDYLSNPQFNQFLNQFVAINYEYTVSSFITVDGQKYFSQPLTIQAKPISDITVEPTPTNFTASNDLPDHVKLCWDWEASKQSEFVIFRENTPIDTVPWTVRTYYDYEAPSIAAIEYQVASYSEGVLSAKIKALGGINNENSLISISGVVSDKDSRVGIPDVSVRLDNAILGVYSAGFISATTTTDSLGRYSFVDVPKVFGIRLDVDLSSNEAVFVNSAVDPPVPYFFSHFVVGVPNTYEINFEGMLIGNENGEEEDEDEDENNEEEVAQALIQGVSATPNAADRNVAIRWSPTTGNYDGFEVRRANVLLATVMPDEDFVVIDSTGFPGEQYGYGVRVFYGPAGDRTYSTTRYASARFPAIAPPINLTATPIVTENLMRIAWSHPLNDHDGYRLTRDGQFKAYIPTSEPQMWYDSTGVPGREYQYQVTAVDGDYVSDPATVIAPYKGVGEVSSLDAIIIDVPTCIGNQSHNNSVRVLWEYTSNAADGFEIYRDGDLIGQIDSITLILGNRPLSIGDTLINGSIGYYDDYSGTPGMNHTYHVLAFVVRDGIKVLSGVEELFLTTTIEFPTIADIKNLTVESQDDLGATVISFEYEKEIANGFEILRNGIVLDTILDINAGQYDYQDITGVPGAAYSYSLRVYDNREGQIFVSTPICVATAIYPSVPTPQNFTASQGTYLSHIIADWEFDNEAFVDSFEIENLTLGTSFRYFGGKRIHQDIVNENVEESYNYRVRALRIVEGETKYSNWSEVAEGWSSNQRTGDEDTVIGGDCHSTFNGFSTDVDGDWAVSGAPDGEESIHIYKRENGGWSLYQVIEGFGGDTDFGYAVAISGNDIVVGEPKANQIHNYTLNDGVWALGSTRSVLGNSSRFGHSIDIEDGQVIVGAPESGLINQEISAVHFYRIENGILDYKNTHGAGSTLLHYGTAVAISGNKGYSLWTPISPGTIRVPVEVTINSNGQGFFSKQYNGANQTISTDPLLELAPDNIDAGGGFIVVGDQVNDRVKIINVATNAVTVLLSSINESGQQFGQSVAISQIPSPLDEFSYVLVGSPSKNLNGESNSGFVNLYTNLSGSWDIEKTFNYEDPKQDDLHGYSVAMSDDAMIYGTPYRTDVNTGAVTINNLIDAPSLVDASDGISSDGNPGETSIYWEYDGIEELVSGFNIYRDGELITFRSASTTNPVNTTTIGGTWSDNTGNPGQRYVYSVASVNTNIPFESYGTADEGFSRPNGIIQGNVITALGSVPIPGVTVRAVGFVKDERYEYSTVSISDGSYIIPNVFYDNAEDIVTTYEMSGELNENIILPEGSADVVMNSALDPVIAQKNIIDYSAYVIKGKIEQPLVNCGLEGVKVYQVIDGDLQLANSAQTDAEGNYSLVVNPNEDDLTSLAVRVEQFRIVEEDTIYHSFAPVHDTLFTDFVGFPLVTELDYQDTLRYTVPIRVKNTCNDRISTAKWEVQIRTDDGCFEETYFTDTNGDLEVDLLPLNYTMKVVDVDVINTANLKAKSYFASFPVSLSLLDTHRDSANTMTFAEIEEDAARQFTYHTAPSIAISGFDEFFCSTPAAVCEQGETYTVSFDITEMHGSDQCSVSEGRIRITNPAAQGDLISFVEYDDVLGKFDDYTFVAGSPTTISPHIYGMAVDYFSVDGNYLGGDGIGIFVEGFVEIEGAAIMVDPASGNEQVPLPIMVLRDPPGDGSSSYIEGGQTIAWTSEFAVGDEQSHTFGVESSFTALGQDFTATTEFVDGDSGNIGNELSSEVTVTQTISTSSDPSLIGRVADIVVGQGLVMSYSVVDEYRVGTCDTINKTSTYSISPTPASTDWFYTVGQIEDIIKGYRNDSIRIELGSLKLQLGDKTLDKEESLNRNNTFINNWNSILEYHSLNTLPHYKICSEIPDVLGLPSAIGQIVNWQNYLCPQLGTGSGANFTLNDDIIWTDGLMDSYNAASISIRNLASGFSGFDFPANGNISTILNKPEVVNEINSYGPPMKNITTSGGVTIEQSITNVNASTSGLSSEFYIDNSINANFGVELEIEIFKGGLVGVGGFGFAGGLVAGTINSLGGFSLQTDYTYQFQSNRSSTRTNTVTNEVTTGYTLYDDDFDDVFSVNVIQPIDQSQTAFFEFIGGQTSCPPEEGAVAIDRPQIAIIDLDAGGTSDSKELNNIPLDEEGIFDIIAINATLINSNPARELEIFLESGTNPNGATLILNGVDLSQGNYVATMGANEPDTLELRVLPGPIAYQYPDIVLGIKPTCSDDPVEYITVSTNFVNPCSPVSLVGPESNWVINNDTSKLIIVMQDYDPSNEILNNAKVQVRRLGQGADWVGSEILSTQLEFGNYVTPLELAVNDSLNLPQETDQYFFVWTIPTDGSFPDGEYEVRVVMDCSQFQETVSNTIRGEIRRDGVKLLGVPEPADGLWVLGDEISATFDKDLDCALLGPNFQAENMSITNLNTGDTLDFDVICYANKLIFELEDDMSTFDGQFLRVDIQNIPSIAGNISDPLSWEFRVITRQLYWNEGDTVDIVLYSGETQQISYRVENTSDVQEVMGISLAAADGMFDSWIQVASPTGTFPVPAGGTDVTFDITANTAVGEFIETINIINPLAGAADPAQLHIRLKVLNEPPGWEVDPTDFTSNMELVANWKFNEGDALASTDITDIISVWVDGEIRGVANIEQAGEFYAAYITVYGNVEDGTDTPLEFHIWDAEEGVEYDGHPATGTEVLYVPLTVRGTIVEPELLFVDREADQARYLHLKQGWTGISFNRETEDMSTAFKLRSLSHETEDDLLVGQNGFIKYTDSLGWFGFGEADLMELNTREGYMIYLENGPDTLRVTGAAAETPDITLTSGWNWIGFPFENIEEIDSSFIVNAGSTGGGPTGNDKINRNYPLDGGALPLSADWTFGNDGWVGSLEDMEANNLYKYYAGNPNGANLSWTATESFRPDGNTASARLASADPLDASTWGLPDYGSEEVMPIIAEVIIEDEVQVSTSDKLAFFYNDSIRAYGEIVYVEEYDQFAISLIGKQIPADSIYDIRYYDASEGSILSATNVLSFDMKGIGAMTNPYEIVFTISDCDLIKTLTLADNPFAIDKTFEASQEIRVMGNHNIPAGVEIILSAPKVTIMDELNTGTGAQIIVRPDGCN